MKGDPSEYYLVQILDNGGKSEFKRVNNLSFFSLWSAVSLRICVEGKK